LGGGKKSRREREGIRTGGEQILVCDSGMFDGVLVGVSLKSPEKVGIFSMGGGSSGRLALSYLKSDWLGVGGGDLIEIRGYGL